MAINETTILECTKCKKKYLPCDFRHSKCSENYCGTYYVFICPECHVNVYQKKDTDEISKDNVICGLQSAIEISGAMVHLRKEHAKAILALLKDQQNEIHNLNSIVEGIKFLKDNGLG